MKHLLKIIALLFLWPYAAHAQGDCTTPGQNPSTAFPVCGTTVFHQTTVPICSNVSVPTPGCGSYPAKNPFWYKFACYQTGTLGFLITPKDQNDDYDWQLFDVTGQDPNNVFTNESLFVTANWAGTYGNTGASNNGVAFIQCGSDPAELKNTFAKMPTIIVGHTYLLLISHFTDSQSGYDLSFKGGTGIITDPTIPHLKSVELNCGYNELTVKLSKKIKCSSLAANGSDFTINAAGVTVIKSTGIGCDEGFDTDSLILALSAPLAPGTYNVSVKVGSDGNTLLDYCDNQVPQTDTLTVTVLPKKPTLMDSILPLACSPQQLTLIFKKAIRCPSVAANGSNFRITGSYPVTVTAAGGNCTNDLSKELTLTLNQPMLQAGTFTITLQKDFDGNTIFDECGEETPPGSQLTFSVKDTVNADFSYNIKWGCLRDTIAVFHPGGNGITGWAWSLDDQQQSTTQNAQGIYTVFNQKNITLAVTNGFCSDTASQTVLLDNFLKADFTGVEDICPNEVVTFTGAPTGQVVAQLWEFGDGGTASTPAATHTYPAPDRQRALTIRYTVIDRFGCRSTAAKPATIYPSCYLAVPNAFTPNGDGLNDFLAPLNAIKATNLEFRIYNRWGQLLYATKNWKQGWDGTFKGQPQPSATYVWMLQFTARDTGKKQQLKGTAVLIR